MTDTLPRSQSAPAKGGRWIEEWHPEDPSFWESTGKHVAKRNLIFSIFAENLAFSVWLLWSIGVTQLNKVGFDLTTSQMFTLTAVPALVGATIRLPYTFAVTRFGGRNWTVFSGLMLLIPCLFLAYCATNPSTPYWVLIAASATAGFGGGNFSSSMTNISFFYPESKKGTALGLNAAGGNIGVAFVQFFGPIIIGAVALGGAATGAIHLDRLGYMYVPLILISVVCAYFFMNNLHVSQATFKEQAPVFKKKQTWVMSFLYIGTFGSFIGYSAAFPTLIIKVFPDVKVFYFAFLGALVGSIARPFGGWLSDKIGGARVTLAMFILMVPGVFGALQGKEQANFGLFLASFLLLFITAGMGNGSTYRMIPAIFQAEAKKSVSNTGGPDAATAQLQAKKDSAAVLGIAGCIGAYGGFLIPRGFAVSIDQTGAIDAAFYGLLIFYAVCVGVTWWYYVRKSFLVAQAPSLAHASV